MRNYHIGMMFGGGEEGLRQLQPHREGTVAVYLTETKEELPSKMVEYVGERVTNKDQLQDGKAEILAYCQQAYPDANLTRIIIVCKD